MSIRVMSYVWATSTHSGSRLLLLLAIADFAHDDGTGAFPSIQTLADKVRMSPRQVVRLVHSLEASGELLVQDGVSRYDTNRLTVILRGDKMSGLRGDRKGPRGDTEGPRGVTQLRHPKRPPSVKETGRDFQSKDARDDQEARAFWKSRGRVLKAMP